MKIANLSFKTDGKTIGVPDEKGKGSLKVADKEDLRKHSEDYMPYCQAYVGGKETGIEIE